MDSHDLIQAAYDPATVAALFESFAEKIRKHLSSVQSGSVPVAQWRDPAENVEAADQFLQKASTHNIDTIADCFGRLADQALSSGQNLNHPHYIGHQVPAAVPLAGLFDALASVTNQVQGVYEMGPWAVSAERALIERIGGKNRFSRRLFRGTGDFRRIARQLDGPVGGTQQDARSQLDGGTGGTVAQACHRRAGGRPLLRPSRGRRLGDWDRPGFGHGIGC